MKSQEFEQLLLERFRQTQYSLWNALITFYAILIGLISVVIALKPNFLRIAVLWIIITSGFCIILMLFNYKRIKKSYEIIQDFDSQQGPNEIKKLGNKFLLIQRLNSYSETISISIAIINLIIIIVIIAFL